MDRSVGAEGDAGGRQRTAPSIRQLVRTLYQEGGLAAFWSGFQVSMVRTLPATLITFVVYEYVAF